MHHPPPQPPKWAHRFLCWFLKEELLEEVEGDLEEKFYVQLDKSSLRRAKYNYWYQVFQYLRPFALKKDWAIHLMSYAMLQNYLRVAWRNLLRYKMYSFIKIGGFALGVTACLLIALFIKDELSYDQHYKQVDRIYRLINEDSRPEANEQWTAFQAPIAEVLKSDYPEIEEVGRIIPYDWYNAGSNQFRRDDQTENNYEEGFAYADQAILQILEIPMVYGDPIHALAQPKTIVLSRRKAEKYFPNEDPTGRIVILNEDEDQAYTVGGVMENFPKNSHLQHDFFLTLEGVEFWPGEQTSWCCSNYNAYMLVQAGTDPRQLEKKLLGLRDNYMVPYYKEQGDQGVDQIAQYHRFHLQPIKDIHLKSGDIHDIYAHSDIRFVWLFGVIAVFILLLAAINFINLSTAKSANRAKEVGLRKVVGSYRSDLVRQFLTESVLFSFISFSLGVFLAYAILPFFNDMAGKTLSIPWTEWWLLPSLLASMLIIGLVAGLYPSFYLSGFKPIDVLKGSLSRGSKASGLQGSLVVFQFTISVILIIGAFTVSRQMDFILNKKLGYDKEQVVIFHGTNTLGDKLPAFKSELLKLAEVKGATISNYLPISGAKRDQNQFWKEGKQKIDVAIGAQIWFVDEDYTQTLGMKLLEGRNFSPEMSADSSAIIINQTMAKALGLKNPIGERITNDFMPTFTVIGLVEDFHFESMKGKIEPLSLTLGNGRASTLSVKVDAENMTPLLKSMTALWDDFMPNQAVRFSFMDERYARMYEEVQRTGKIFTGFSILAIVIACLGLFALSAFMVEQRKKEVSIRKVLGASMASLFNLLTVNFLKLILIAFVIAMPIGWYMMKKWLEDYTYHIPITWDVFVIAGGIIFLIAILTISFESIKAALINPIKSLRSE